MPRYGVEDWLRLFSMTFLLTMVVVFIWVMTIAPIFVEPEELISTPYSRSRTNAPGVEQDVNIGIRTDGRLTVHGHSISRRALTDVLTTMSSLGGVCVHVETGTPYRYVRGVVSAARDAGRPRVTFLVRPRPASRTDVRESSAL